jgi:hypothetical protein
MSCRQISHTRKEEQNTVSKGNYHRLQYHLVFQQNIPCVVDNKIKVFSRCPLHLYLFQYVSYFIFIFIFIFIFMVHSDVGDTLLNPAKKKHDALGFYIVPRCLQVFEWLDRLLSLSLSIFFLFFFSRVDC